LRRRRETCSLHSSAEDVAVTSILIGSSDPSTNMIFSCLRIRSFIFFSKLLLVVAVVVTCQATRANKPNIIVIIADDLGVGDIGFSGGKDIPTPHLDRLAAEGTIFRNGYASPMCAPSRVAFLTGRNPEKIGFEDNRPGDSRHSGMDLSVKTVANVLHESGYATGLVGKWHVGRGLKHEFSPWNRGFDEFLGYYGAFGKYLDPILTSPPGTEKGIEGYSTDIFTDEACRFIERHKTKPFFLNVAFNAAHLEQVAKPEDIARFAQIQDPKRRKAAAIISNLDSNIGRIALRLKELDLDRDTLLVFFSDNGGEPPILGTMNGPFRGMKFDLYEGGIRVPFFVRWPGHLPAGKTSDDLVSVIDLLPTFAAAVGTKGQEGVDGMNLLPRLRGESSKQPHQSLFWRTTSHAALQRMRKQAKGATPVYVPHLSAVRDGEWKLLAFDDEAKLPRIELYNLEKDPSESNNIAAENEKIVKRLSSELAGWRSTLKPQIVPPLK
jgi:arylsulfatase A-like enzyme